MGIVKNRTYFFGLLFVLMTHASWACIWDSDTLRTESLQFPGTVDILVGRFERNPPLYYEMRLDRVSKELINNPEKLELYDDAGVASERLGKTDDAIKWMEKKKLILNAITKQDENYSEHLYRYFANLGTFYAHKWAKSEDLKASIGELILGRAMIMEAIRINHDAHFGREIYQLAFLSDFVRLYNNNSYKYDAISSTSLTKYSEALTNSLNEVDFQFLKDLDEQSLYQHKLKGLLGLVVLGNGWESIDIFFALEIHLSPPNAYLGYLAGARRIELIESNHRSLNIINPPTFTSIQSAIYPYQKVTQQRHFKVLRENADKWHEHRKEFMLSRLKQGLHPDVNPDFWDGYKEIPPMKIPYEIRYKREAIIILVGCLFLAFVIAILMLNRKLKNRKLTKSVNLEGNIL